MQHFPHYPAPVQDDDGLDSLDPDATDQEFMAILSDSSLALQYHRASWEDDAGHIDAVQGELRRRGAWPACIGANVLILRLN
jgi:hypothetical protein